MIEVKVELVVSRTALAEMIKKYRNDETGAWEMTALVAVPGAYASNPDLSGGKETEYTIVFERQKRGTRLA